jgi:DNA polymerase elongation subunit (family B)
MSYLKNSSMKLKMIELERNRNSAITKNMDKICSNNGNKTVLISSQSSTPSINITPVTITKSVAQSNISCDYINKEMERKGEEDMEKEREEEKMEKEAKGGDEKEREKREWKQGCLPFGSLLKVKAPTEANETDKKKIKMVKVKVKVEVNVEEQEEEEEEKVKEEEEDVMEGEDSSHKRKRKPDITSRPMKLEDSIKKKYTIPEGYVPKLPLSEESYDIFEAMKGEDKANQALKNMLECNIIGLESLEQIYQQNENSNKIIKKTIAEDIRKYQKMQGQIIVNPTLNQLPSLRPVKTLDNILGERHSEPFLDFGVTDIYHLHVSNKIDKIYKDELWLQGVTEGGFSVNLEIKDFKPSFIIRRKVNTAIEEEKLPPFTSEDCIYWQLQLNRYLHQDECKQQWGSHIHPLVEEEDSSTIMLNQQYLQLKSSHVIDMTIEERTPGFGFTNLRKDSLLRVIVKNQSKIYNVAKAALALGMIVEQDKWSLTQQFIHASRSYHLKQYKNGGIDGIDGIDEEIPRRYGISLNEWLRIDRSKFQMIDGFIGNKKQTSCQIEGSLTSWKELKPLQEIPYYKDKLIPHLCTAFDIEQLPYRYHVTGVETFPKAMLTEDCILGISAVFYLDGFSHAGPCLRVYFGYKNHKPLPNTITYTFDNEAALLEAFSYTIRSCDSDALTGHNSIAYDTMTLAQKSKLYQIERQFNKNLSRYNSLPCSIYPPIDGNYCYIPNVAETSDNDDDDDDDDDEEEEHKKCKKKKSSPQQEEEQVKIKKQAQKKRERIPSLSIPGRWQFDLLKVVPSFLDQRLDNYRLRTIANVMLSSGVNKLDLPIEMLGVNFYGSDYNRSHTAFYCVTDSLITFKCEQEKSLLGFFKQLSSTTNTSVAELLMKGQQIRVYHTIIETIHLDGWYENSDILKQLCYSEDVPDDWNYWSDDNPHHQFLSKHYYRGDIEPVLGYNYKDPRAHDRDEYWRKNLLAPKLNGALLEAQTKWMTLSEEDRHVEEEKIKRQVEIEVESMMYSESSRKRARKENGTLTSSNDLFFPYANATAMGNANAMVNANATAMGNGATVRAMGNGATVRAMGNGATVSPIVGGQKRKTMDNDIKVMDNDDFKVNVEVEKQHSLPSLSLMESQYKNKDDRTELATFLSQKGRKRKVWPGEILPLAKLKSKGGLVQRIMKGLYHEPMSVVDFESLYPSIVRSEDFDYTTLVMDPYYLNIPGVTYRREAVNGKFFIFAVVDPHKLSTTETLKKMKSGPSPLPQGQFPTILPKILVQFTNDRKIAKQKKAQALQNDQAGLVQTYECRQLALKVICNATYGFLIAGTDYAYLPCPAIGSFFLTL